MGAASSVSPDTDVAASKKIDAEMRALKKELTNTIKLLLLGTAECGKSTTLKQMRILNASGFTETEYKAQRTLVIDNIISSIQTILHGMKTYEIPLTDTSLQPDADRLISHTLETADIPPALVDSIGRLWADAGVKLCALEKGADLQLIDSAAYFLDRIRAVAAPDYTPTQDDILRLRVRTTGIVEVTFAINGKQFRVFDVGGQRSERKKWIRCFDGVTSVLFISAVSEYDQRLREDEKTNRVIEALSLFEMILRSQWFISSTIILFLNKIDLFKEKLIRRPLNDYFPSYTGDNDYESAIEYMRNKFLKLNPDPNKMIYSHTTCATDTEQVESILNDTMSQILRRNLSNAQLA